MAIDKKTHKKQKQVAKLLKKWSKEPITKEEEQQYKEFEKELKKDRFNLPE